MLIRDQTIIGVRDEDSWKNALKEQWDLKTLEDHSQRAEAASTGAATQVAYGKGPDTKLDEIL